MAGLVPGIPVPDPQAPHEEWARYAVSRGMPAGHTRVLTRDQLRIRLMPPPAPDPHATREAWAGYAVSRGMPAGEARVLTRDQLRRAMSSAEAIGGAPELARMDQDPAAVSARREAGRKPWGAA